MFHLQEQNFNITYKFITEASQRYASYRVLFLVGCIYHEILASITQTTIEKLLFQVHPRLERFYIIWQSSIFLFALDLNQEPAGRTVCKIK